ncbi:MAG: relaxase domain-containing protein, partial [Rhodospirillales bacterium]|nr:relaxase domain-containing protein [Rhodospirillales bacterium]
MVATVRNLTSASATSEYFRNEGGYYLEDGEGPEALRAKREEHREASAWHGKGAATLGLKAGARVAAGKFEKLLRGEVLGTDLRLGRMRDGQHEHRPGFDITFSAPKSVSLAALLPTADRPRGNRAVIRAHDAAVRATLDWIEATLLQTRGWDPATRTRPRVSAPSMVAATFRHIASRNLDPQLHTHAVIANVTRDSGGRWKSVEPTLLHRNVRLIGAYYRNELSRRLIAEGYSVLPAMAGRIPSFELAGYAQEVCEAFSTRRRDILAYLERKGVAYSTASAQVAALAGRKAKAEPVRAILQRQWAERARELGLDRAESVARTAGP